MEAVFIRPESAAAMIQLMSHLGKITLVKRLDEKRYLAVIGCFDPTCKSYLVSMVPAELVDQLRQKGALIAEIDMVVEGRPGEYDPEATPIARIIEMAKVRL